MSVDLNQLALQIEAIERALVIAHAQTDTARRREWLSVLDRAVAYTRQEHQRATADTLEPTRLRLVEPARPPRVSRPGACAPAAHWLDQIQARAR